MSRAVTNRQTEELILAVKGADDVMRLKKELDKTEQELLAVKQAMDKGNISQKDYARQTQILSQRHVDLNTQFASASKAAAGVQRGTRDMGRAMMAAQIMVDDFTGATGDLGQKLRGVQNNIPQLVMALGGGAGLTAVVSLAGVAVISLIKNWDSLKGAWSDGATETEAERMKRLADETKRAKAETEKLQQALGERTKAERETVAIAAEAIREAGGGGLTGIQRVRAGLAATAPRISTADEARRAAANQERLRRAQEKVAEAREQAKFGGIGSSEALIAAEKERAAAQKRKIDIQREISDRIRSEQEALAKRAQVSPEGVEELIARVQAQPGAFPQGLAQQLIGARPEERERAAAAKKQAAEAKRQQAADEKELERIEEEDFQASIKDMRRRRKVLNERQEEEDKNRAGMDVQVTGISGGPRRLPRLPAVRARRGEEAMQRIDEQLARYFQQVELQQTFFAARLERIEGKIGPATRRLAQLQQKMQQNFLRQQTIQRSRLPSNVPMGF